MHDDLYRRFDNPGISINNSSEEEEDEDVVDELRVDGDNIGIADFCCGEMRKDGAVNNNAKMKQYLVLKRISIAVIIGLLLLFFYSIIVIVSRSSNNDIMQQQLQPPVPINSSEGTRILDALCDDVQNGLAAGDACDWICTDSPRNYTLTGFFEGGSKRVMKLRLNDKDVVLKMHHAYSHEYDDPIDVRVDDYEFTDKVLEIVNEQLKMDWPQRYKQHLMRMLWPDYRGQNDSLSDAEKRSLWMLLQQEEYINLRTLKLARVLPKVKGSCGHVYQTEYLIPFKMKTYYMNLKAKILVHLMGTLKLFYEFFNEPLHWCDVKFENLGLSAEYPRRFMVMDADMLYTESKLTSLLSNRSCLADEECNFFDCQSKCNKTTGFCTPRLNDNVDVFCNKLIKRLFGSFWSKSNKYLSACHDTNVTAVQRLTKLRYVWAWSFADI